MHTKKLQRVDFIDIARGIGIVLMVMGHCDNIGKISSFVNLFHMSLFIFLSGYLFKNRQINSFSELIIYLWKRIYRLYSFYLIFEILFYLCSDFFLEIGFYSSHISYGGKFIFPIQSFKDFVLHILQIVILMGREPFCAAFWFIVSLIFVTSGYAILNYVSNKQKIISNSLFVLLGCVLSFCIGCTVSALHINIPRLFPAFTFLLIYHLGNLYYIYQKNFNLSSLLKTIIFFASIIILIILHQYGKISMNSNSFPNFAFFLLSSFCGIYAVIFLSKMFAKIKVLSKIFLKIGKSSLLIMALHLVAFKIVMFIQYLFGAIKYEDIARLTGYDNNNGWYIVYVLVGVFVPIMFSDLYYLIIRKIVQKIPFITKKY